MALDLSFASIVTFFIVISLLVVYSILDLRDRRVENELILAGGIIGMIVAIITGHIASNLILHVTAVLLTIPLVYLLFRLGSIGGADAKVLFLVELVSPGIELGYCDYPVLETIIGLGGLLFIMLLGGYLFWRFVGRKENTTPPLLPFLLMGYLAIQIITLF